MFSIDRATVRPQGNLNFSIEALAEVIPPAMIREVLEETGKTPKRVRKLPADLVIHLVVGMGMARGESIRNVFKSLSKGFRGKLQKAREEPPGSCAITQARRRLGVEPMRKLYERQGKELAQEHDAQQQYQGMRVVGVDGTTLKLPDRPENEKEFGRPKSGRGRSAFPMMRVVSLLAVLTHVSVAAVFGPYAMGELTLALTLLSQVGPGTLVLMDRGYCSFLLWWRLSQQGAHFITRSKRRMKFRRRKKLGEGDWLVEFRMPSYLKRRHPELPDTLEARLIRYQMPGFRASWLITSLQDPEKYPKDELILLYHRRWEIELAYASIKTRLRPSGRPLRSESPELARQEAYGVLLAYNSVRGLMARAALQAKLPALRLSFTDSLHQIREAMLQMAQAATALLREMYRELLSEIARCVLPERRARHNPRAVKVKMSGFPLKRVAYAS